MTYSDLLAILERHIQQAGGVTKFARQIHVSRTYLYDVVNGRREAGPAILEALGVRKVVTYELIEDEVRR